MVKIISAKVFHERLIPMKHKFSYSVNYINFSIDHLDQLKNSLFSINSFNLFSFYLKDYLDGLDGPHITLRGKLKNALASENIDCDGEIFLSTFPRILGYGFNPVSFWRIYNQEKKLEAIFCEVNNTFGDRHYYLIKNAGEIKKVKMNKEFHVSPFFDIIGQYEFSFSDKVSAINYFNNDQLLFKSSIADQKVINFSAFNLLKLFLSSPFASFMVMGRIHYQALRLYLKKAPFFKRPEPPINRLSKEVI